MKKVAVIKKIERSHYPAFMRQMQDCRTMKDIADYCECSLGDLKVVCDGRAYMLASADEVCDLAGRVSPSFIRNCFATLEGWYTADLREVTAKYLGKLHARGRIELEEEGTWDWDGDRMVSVRFRVK